MMLVSELIEALQKMPPGAQVHTSRWDGDYNEHLDLESIRPWGKIRFDEDSQDNYVELIFEN